ncbi:hypothetical protein LaR308_11950 [Lacticaseibacillus rhamnosus]|nr:hypothetical protein [Lacticaseibacillus rhamnosus]KIC96992.1 hypothetical protein LaR308_11950 [Lacticaseibacillus rhamnosus]
MTETKQYVFNALMADMSHGSEQWRARYDAAFPDDLPVIPKEVGEYIQWGKSYDVQLYMMYISQLIHRPGFKKLTDDAKSCIISSSNIFARAWVLGAWKVEETGEIIKLEDVE